MGPPSKDYLCPLDHEEQSILSMLLMACSMTRFLSSLRTRLMLLHPSPNCSLRAESLVHVHFKEEIGIAELIPLVTTYIILFAYIYFSTRKSMAKSLGAFCKLNGHFQISHFPASGGGLGRDVEHAWWSQKPGLHPPAESQGLGWVHGSSRFSKKDPSWVRIPKRHTMPLGLGSVHGHPFLWLNQGPSLPRLSGHTLLLGAQLRRVCMPGSGGDAALMCPLCPPGKIDMVKSKWGLALAAVVTVLSSLLMSVGLCTLFGLTPTLNGG